MPMLSVPSTVSKQFDDRGGLVRGGHVCVARNDHAAFRRRRLLMPASVTCPRKPPSKWPLQYVCPLLLQIFADWADFTGQQGQGNEQGGVVV